MMIKIKRLLALSLSILLVITALPIVSMANTSQYNIEWMAGYQENGGHDIFGYVTLSGGGSGTYGNLGNDHGDSIVFDNNNHLLNFDITASATGAYILETEASTHEAKPEVLHAFANDIEFGTLYIADGAYIDYHKGYRAVGTVNLKAGETTKISLSNKTSDDATTGSGLICVRGLRLIYIPPITFKASSIEDGATALRSTDVITLEYNSEIDESLLKDAVITLNDSDDKAIAYKTAVNKDNSSKLDIILTETLSYGKGYILSVSGVKDIKGTSSEKTVITFSVASEDESPANSTVTAEVGLKDKTFDIKGTVKGSLGQTIAGRKVEISVTSPLGNDKTLIDTVTSLEDGSFEITYELPQEYQEIGGEYIFDFEAEHGKESVFKGKTYLTDEEKLLLLGSVEDAKTTDEIYDVLNTNASLFGIDMSSLERFGDNDELFLERLLESSYRNEDGELDIDELKKVWDIAYALEDINLSDDDAVTKAYLEDEFFIAQTEFDTEKYLLLDAVKDEFVSAVTALKRMETAEDFGKETDTLLNNYVLKEKGISTPELSINDVSVYKGQVAETELELSKKTEDIKEYTLTVICPSKDVAEDVTLDAPSKDCKVSREEDGEKVIFTVSEADEALSALGTLNSSPSSNAILKVSAVVVYDIDGIEISAELSEVSAEVSVKSNSSKGGSGSSSGISLGGSYNPSQNTSVVTPNTPSETNDGFTDLESVSWAEDSIMNLYNKGIISEAPDGRFRPDDSITRAEFVKLLVSALGIKDASARVTLSDVSSGDWYYDYVAIAVENGLVLGDDKGNFRPNDRITRQDICVIVSRAMDSLGYREEASDTALFYDDIKISDYAKKAVYRMRAHEIVNGTGDGSFAPLSDATRAATAKIIDTFMKEANI